MSGRDIFGGGSDVFGPTGGSGTSAEQPLATDVPENYSFFVTDDNGGTLYRAIGGVWVKAAASVFDTGGRELGYAMKNDANVSTPAGGAATDIPGVSVSFTAGSRPIIIKAGATDMSVNAAGIIVVYQVVRTDTGATLAMARGTHATISGRIPIGTVEGRMSGLTVGNSYTVKAQILSASNTATLLCGNAGGAGAWVQAVEG